MYNDLSGPLDMTEELEQFMQVISIAAGLLMLDRRPVKEFLHWARSSLPIIAPTMFVEQQSEEERSKKAYWIGVNLWNSAPHPDNHYKTRPLPRPGRNERCPCGSGLKFKQCCAHFTPPPPVPEGLFWSAMSDIMSKAEILRQIKNQQLPVVAIGTMASHFLEAGDYKQVIQMLDPLFGEHANKLGKQHSGLLDLLCDSYNAHYKTEKKKKDLLQRLSQHKNNVIRAEAWQRLASWKLDQGDNAAAFEALNQAMRSDPGNPSHSLLELSLLVAENRLQQARERADFWLRKLRHLEDSFPDLIYTLERAREDPRAALQSGITSNDDDPRLQTLIDWVEDNAFSEDIPHYQVVDINSHEDPPADIPPQVDILAEAVDDPIPHAIHLQAPDTILQLEQQWWQVYPVGKPFSVHFEVTGAADIWLDMFHDQWLKFLQAHPEAMNSLEILDDITSLIYMHPLNQTHWGPMNNLQPLLEHAENIIRQANIPEHKVMPWIMTENRPALRLLAHAINLAIDHDQLQSCMEKIRFYLRLNPSDNHGYRSMLVNYCLQQGLDQQALSIARNYPDDMLAETRYGQALALYRLGDSDAAEQALSGAIHKLPLVADYLLKSRAAQPQFSEHGISLGGKDQAWLYRDEMRDCWRQTEGAMAWLKQGIKNSR